METKMIVAYAVVAMCIFAAVNSKRYCKRDTDCSSLGGLYCIKSSCNYGICACPRSTVARWLGSERLFQCVPLKKVGESCSTDGDTGVCGALGSRCESGICECGSGVSVWGGEYCASDSQQTGPGDSCSGSIGNCALSTGSVCVSTTGANWHDEVIGYDYPTCSCPNDRYLAIFNWYDNFDFIGRKQPNCFPKYVGAYCLKNSDCANIGGTSTAECVSNKCVCPSGSVQHYDKSQCNNGTALGYGAICAGTGHVTYTYCNGAQGLVCGETCTIYETPPTVSFCRCGPSYHLSGSSCSPNVVGSSCYGDQNCKSLGFNGICVDSKCENGSMAAGATMVTMVTVLLIAMLC